MARFAIYNSFCNLSTHSSTSFIKINTNQSKRIFDHLKHDIISHDTLISSNANQILIDISQKDNGLDILNRLDMFPIVRDCLNPDSTLNRKSDEYVRVQNRINALEFIKSIASSKDKALLIQLLQKHHILDLLRAALQNDDVQITVRKSTYQDILQ